jgi:hypothetical protein
MSGYGTIMWRNGRSYTGNWRNNKRNGVGSLYYTDGKIAEGMWNDDNPTGEFKIIWPNDDPRLRRTIIIPAIELEDFDEGDDDSDAGTI